VDKRHSAVIHLAKSPHKIRGTDMPPTCTRRDFLGLSLAGLATPLLAACGGDGDAAAPATPESVQWLREGILAALNRRDTDLTAVSVALFADDSVIYREAFGYANRDTQLPATVDTPFNIGSVSKVVAALAVMILRDQGLLELDQPVVELLPAFSMMASEYDYRKVTVRHLISHSSGFPGSNYRNSFSFAPIPGFAQDTLEALKLSRLKHAPGELAVYCNDGFTMVELLTLELAGLSYTDFIQREVFDPLGMSASGFMLAPAEEGAFVHPVRGGLTLPQEFAQPYATGGILTTPTDMMKLARMFLDGGVYEEQRIVSEEGLREMGVDQTATLPINPGAQALTRYGLGWDSVAQLGMQAAGLLSWQKNGGTQFFSSEFFVLPQARLAILISGNSQSYGATALAEGLLLRTAVERGLIPAMPPAMVRAVPPAVPALDVSALLGIYANTYQPMQVVDAGGGALTLNGWSEGGGWAPIQANLRLRDDGRWWTDGITDNCYRFSEVQGHRYLTQRILVNDLYWGENPLCEWLPEADEPQLSQAWLARLNVEWVITNEDPQSLFSGSAFVLTELPERPG
jgi:CubicO group peptidase (beta-lactamase class C family)